MVFLVFWIGAGIVAGNLAKNRGHSMGAWVALGILCPVIFIPAAYFLKAKPDALMSMGVSQKCPHCAEFIKADARVCRYCGRDIVATPQRAPLS